MQEYWINDPALVVRTADQAFIPLDPGNRDYVAYLAWAKGGKTAGTLTDYLALLATGFQPGPLAILNPLPVTLVS